MSAKQDRIYTRTASQLKQEFNFGESFAEVMGIATDAQKAAKEAQDAADNPSAKLTQDEIFNLLTNNGANQGIYRADDGEIYINASYLKSGTILADLIKGGVLSSQDESVQMDLASNKVVVQTNDDQNVGKIELAFNGLTGYGVNKTTGNIESTLRIMPGCVNSAESTTLSMISSGNGVGIAILPANGQELLLGGYGRKTILYGDYVEFLGKQLSWKDNGDGTYTLIGT